jgi:hypothetical protein
MTNSAENQIRQALASQRIHVGDKHYTVILNDCRAAAVHERVLLKFTAISGHDSHQGEILVRQRRLDRPDLIGAVILEMAQKIIEGKLPPDEPILV